MWVYDSVITARNATVAKEMEARTPPFLFKAQSRSDTQGQQQQRLGPDVCSLWPFLYTLGQITDMRPTNVQN